jgi:uncharacterized membrane protein
MGSLPSLLVGTVLLRPYVFIFLAVYLVGCSMQLGLRRALLFGVAGYLITWLSEYSSIHNGIPYGLYHYIEATRGKEIWVLGVPLMDSMSYVFLAYASYAVALVALSPVISVRGMPYLLETKMMRGSLSVRMLGALFMVYLDIIIDPVALRGGKWFLGEIYGYPAGGVYFGVPVSNFIGWLLVGFLLVWTLQAIDAYLDKKKERDYQGYRYPWRYMAGPALYVGVLLFNLWITFSIGEYNLGWVDLFIILLPAAILYSAIRSKALHGAALTEAVEAHLRDLPHAHLPKRP